jgi:prepilin-type N-terminal cleavage/methylation domain-containing protein
MKKAFTLIELLSVIIIIGIISALAVPNLKKFRARVLQNRMKNTLQVSCETRRSFLYFQRLLPTRKRRRPIFYILYIP